MCCVLKHIKENQDFAWKTTTWLVHPPPFPSLVHPWRKGKCVFSEVLFQNNIHTINRSEKYIFQNLQWNPHVCLHPDLFVWFCRDAKGSRGIDRFTVGCMWGCWETGVFAVSRESTWRSLWNKVVVVWQFSGSFPVTVWAFVITTKEHTSRVKP